ncbi:MAG: hypothetical protein SWH61_11640 [Thermodesulfobacteriota bacterium]|nr:hypothetical protein [Thermodesulfobacteriota bacterium]
MESKNPKKSYFIYIRPDQCIAANDVRTLGKIATIHRSEGIDLIFLDIHLPALTLYCEKHSIITKTDIKETQEIILNNPAITTIAHITISRQDNANLRSFLTQNAFLTEEII